MDGHLTVTVAISNGDLVTQVLDIENESDQIDPFRRAVAVISPERAHSEGGR